MTFLLGLSSCCQDPLPPPPAGQTAEEDTALHGSWKRQLFASEKAPPHALHPGKGAGSQFQQPYVTATTAALLWHPSPNRASHLSL